MSPMAGVTGSDGGGGRKGRTTWDGPRLLLLESHQERGFCTLHALFLF